MWGKPDNSKRNDRSFQAGAGETTYIAADAEFNGKLTLKGSARIDGKLEGQIILSGDLMVGPSAVINANIKANSISISGEVRGDVITQETLELCSTARLNGNIFSKQLKIDQGAQFVGTSRRLDDVKQAVKAPEEVPSAAAGEQNSEDSIDVDIILKPLDPLEDEATESTSDNETTPSKNVAFGKSSKSRRR